MKGISVYPILVIVFFVIAAANLYIAENYDRAIVFAIFAVLVQLCLMEEKMK